MALRAAPEKRVTNRIPPHDLDAEESVLGAMLESREAIANVIEILDADDFYKPAHGEIYDAILALYGEGQAADAITVADELTRRGKLDYIGGRAHILGLIEAYPTASSAKQYARIVEEHAVLRRLIEAGNEVQEIGFSLPDDVEGAVDQAEEIIYNVGERRLRDDIQPIRPLLTKSMIDIETLYERGESVIGVPSGFNDLDDMTSGWQPSNLIIIAARPSMGKSSLLNDIALHASMRDNQPVVIFSLEMSRHEIVKRFLASEARVDAGRLSRGTLQEQDWTRLSAALGRLAEAPIFIDDSPNITLMEMRAKCRRLKAKHGLGLVIIDYLQLMQSPRKSENRQQEVSEISRSLKILAKELSLPVLCASQLNRGVEYRADKRPLLGDLRESGCVTGGTLITLASGERVAIRELVGTTPEVATLSGWHLSTRRASKVWKTGTEPVFRVTTASGRTLRATANHPFLRLDGWAPLELLSVGERVGIPRSTARPLSTRVWPEDHLVLLAHLIGDGSVLARQPLRYATQSRANAEAVIRAAENELVGTASNPNNDTVPVEIWGRVKAVMEERGISHRRMQELRNVNYGGSSHFSRAPSRSTLLGYAELLDDVELKEIATSDVYWDTIVAIDPDGIEDVYDMTVPGTHNFIGDGVILHNSIEQDADMVMFIYRDEVYNPDTEHKGEAELIVAKHRNGPTGTVRLAFMNQYTKFASIARGHGR